MSKLIYKNIMMLFVAVGLMLVPDLAHAFSINVDGNLSEWGVTPGAWSTVGGVRVNNSDWVPNAGILSTVEDSDPAGTGYLNPGWGGQPFDAEAMYATYDSTNLYFAIATGKSPDLVSGYRPGDIAFDFGQNGSYEYGIKTTGADQGGAYSAKTWAQGLWNTYDVTEMTAVNNSLGPNVPLVYNNTSYGSDISGNHYVIITKVTDTEVTYTDPGSGPENALDAVTIAKEDFLKIKAFFSQLPAKTEQRIMLKKISSPASK